MDDYQYKVELHVHLDGAMRLTTLLEIAKKKGIIVPEHMHHHMTEEEFREAVLVHHARSFYKVLSAFKVFMPIVAGDRDAISRIAYEFCEDCSKHNIRYVEARYSPQLFASNEETPEYAQEHGDLTPREVVKIICDSFKRGSKDFGINAKSILCCMRHRPDWSNEIVSLADDFRNEGVVAVDLAGGFKEGNPEFTPDEHKVAFNKAKTLNIHRTVHAGEAGPHTAVVEAIKELYAERIGHGYHCRDDENTYNLVRSNDIHLETCPISSICTGAVDEHETEFPVAKFAKDGTNFSINSDDPSVFDTHLVDDYKRAEQMGLSRKAIIKSIYNAARSCFAPEEEKKKLIEELNKVYGSNSQS